MAGLLSCWIATVIAIIGYSLTSSYVAAVEVLGTKYPDLRCETNAPPQRALNFTSVSVPVGPRPWGLVYLNENFAFAAINFSIGVLDTRQFEPRLLNMIPFPEEFQMGNEDITSDGYGYRELILSHDKRNLYVATGYGAVILDTTKAILGSNESIAGVLSSNGYVGRSAVELSITPDDKFVFISQEFGSNASYNRGAVEVYKVTREDDGKVSSIWRGFIALGFAVVGQQFSKDNTKLFVTSELNTTKGTVNDTAGIISVLDVATLKVTPGKALITRLNNGCRPVRCDVSLDGRQLWVTERDANTLAIFDADELALGNNNTDEVLLGAVTTGTSPIGIAEVGRYVLTADSNRFNYENATTGVTVVDTITMQQLGQIPTSAFPRSLAVSPSGNRLLVSEFGAGTIRAIDVTLLNRF
ncbi:hypothetical protein PFICI_00123 [Pestalotiopsis fici W106-1]|uniref:SMP-30/Gluconolactonase/LRE-like region domain-containing protein n=1 Tax=Pestalotiopsis fici (strain W106-1 / CGMCC3.15140) TaxID=1229662 RepID=W3XJW9_PESFW|nr:uncharacterized protein PFICI_00123 [Pestalotiopsis fici W106-1]ETS86295.1 hypothetical protein PFICI_00123 [Pestalotiopsis fici W106-1]